MKVLFIGDIVGSIGRDAVEKYLPRLKRSIIQMLLLQMGKMLRQDEGLLVIFITACYK